MRGVRGAGAINPPTHGGLIVHPRKVAIYSGIVQEVKTIGNDNNGDEYM